MTRIPAGIYSPATAKLVLDVVKYLQAAGWIPKDGQRGQVKLTTPAPLFVRNDSDEEIPGWACMQAIGTVEADGMNYLTVDKPADTTGLAGVFVFNGPEPIEIDGYGLAHAGPLVRALGDGSTATAGETWTPTVDAWTIEPGGTLLTMVGADDIDTDVVRVSINATSGGAILAKTPGGGIAARTGSGPWTPGVATCTLCEQYDDSGTWKIREISPTEDVTVYNSSPHALAASVPVQAKPIGGKYYVDVGECA